MDEPARTMLTLPGGTPPTPRGRVARMVQFVRPYTVAAAGALYLFTLGLARRSQRGLIVELASRFGHAHTSREPAELPPVHLDALVPCHGPIDVRAIEATNGNVSELELIAICRIARAAAPRRTFEFGTFDGRTTLNLAANAPPGSIVYSLDLPRSALAATAARIDPAELQYADKDESGARYRGTALEDAIVQLYGDSGTFDYGELRGSMDLVFVDASHTYDYVVNDSLQAIQLIRPEGGTILWHDYARWDGVTRALNELRRLDRRFAALQWIEGTTLAVLRVGTAARVDETPGARSAASD